MKKKRMKLTGLAWLMLTVAAPGYSENVGVKIDLQKRKLSWMVMNADLEEAMDKVVVFMKKARGEGKPKPVPKNMLVPDKGKK